MVPIPNCVTMILQCDTSVAESYKSPAQMARLISECWFRQWGYCLACQCDELRATPANTKAADFVCPACEERYELKTFKNQYPKVIPDGAYKGLMSCILGGSVPSLVLLERNASWEVQTLTAVHNLFITPEVVVSRKPLSISARRAGWIGCNIRLDRIADDGKIEIVSHSRVNSRESTRKKFRMLNRLKKIKAESRGWTILTLGVVRGLARREFSLKEIYAKEDSFREHYPNNANIRPKLRQQLQILRDLGYVEFLGGGEYRLLL